MRLRGFPPDGQPALSYVGAPTGSIIGSAKMPIGKILSVPGRPGPPGTPGDQGPQGEGLHIDGTVRSVEDLPPASEHPLELWAVSSDGNFWLSDGSVWYEVAVRGPVGPPGTTSWNHLQDIPPVFPPEDHTHGVGDVEGLQGQLDDKVSQVESPSRVYGTTATGGQTTYPLSAGSLDNATVVLRGEGGRFSAGAPTEDSHVANKGYVDVGLAGKANSSHSHVVGDVAGLQAALDAKLEQEQVDTRITAAIQGLIGTSPDTLDTLEELAAAIGDDPNFAVTVGQQIAEKADKTTTITAGAGLTGGGSLASSRTLAVNFGSTAGTVAEGNDPRLSDARTPTPHSHALGDVAGLQAELDGKAAASHTHTIGNVTGLQAALDGKANASHTHPNYVGGDGSILNVVRISAIAYEQLNPKSSTTLYVIVG